MRPFHSNKKNSLIKTYYLLIPLLFHLGKSKEAEVKRINKELANIRSKFKGDKTLDGYQKKKYVCKLLFIFLLGHDIDFGFMEAVNLLSSNKYSEKQIVSIFHKIYDLNFIPFLAFDRKPSHILYLIHK